MNTIVQLNIDTNEELCRDSSLCRGHRIVFSGDRIIFQSKITKTTNL